MNNLFYVNSVAAYLLSFLWGIYILISFIGWGKLVNQFLFPRNKIDWGLAAAWGLALSIVVGGILNLIQIISIFTVLVYLLSGIVLFLILYFNRTKSVLINLPRTLVYSMREDKVFFFGVLLILFLLVIRYGGWVYVQWYNHQDDYQAYMVFPYKMLQIGSMGQDPFSERRMLAFGGQSFLHTFMLTLFTEKSINLIDSGVALLIATGLLLGFLREKNISKNMSTLILLLFLLIPAPKLNISALITSLCLFISLFRLMDLLRTLSGNLVAKASIVALLIAAICSLKSTLIPMCGTLLILHYLLYFYESQNKKRAMTEFILACFLIFLFLLPWMVSMYHSSGTFLYPLLGEGYHFSAYGYNYYEQLSFFGIAKILFSLFATKPVIILLFLSFASIAIPLFPLSRNKSILIILISSIISTAILGLTARSWASRYIFSFIYPAILMLIIIILSHWKEWIRKDISAKSASVLIGFFIAGLFIGNPWNDMCLSKTKQLYFDCISNIKYGLKNASVKPSSDFESYSKFQSAIPNKETILVRLAKPFLLNFSRNKIYIIDYISGGPPPGIPFFEGAEVLARYLLLNGIRYVAYSYSDEGGFPKERFGDRLSPIADNVTRVEAKLTFNFQDNLIQLSQNRERIYDDGNIYVLDLANKLNGVDSTL